MSVIEHIISFIAPHACLACSVEGAMLCNQCVRLLPKATERCYRCSARSANGATCGRCKNATNLSNVMSAVAYSDVAKDIVQLLKFERSRAAIAPMALIMGERYHLGKHTVITFAPAATTRVRMRGYDQSYLLAKALGRAYNAPVLPLLARAHNTRQVGSTGQERRAQQHDAFRAINMHAIHNKKILIVDDVITTGATLEACAAVLTLAGARQVDAYTFAQA